MRLLLPLVLAAALGGCVLTDCPSQDPLRVAAAEVRREAAPVADTLTVLFVDEGDYGREATMQPAGPLRPVASADGSLRLSIDARVYSGPTDLRFETAVQGDTVFVRRPPELIRTACSVATGAFFRVTRIEAPAGVGVVRVRTVGSETVPFPTRAPAAHARVLLTV